MRLITFLTVRPDPLLAANFELEDAGVYKGSAEPLLPPGLVSAFLLTPFFTFDGVNDELKFKLTFAGCAK